MKAGDDITDTDSKFTAATQQLQRNIAYSYYNSDDKKHEVYQNDGTSTNKRSGRAGNVNLTIPSNYPINGKLTVANGQKLVFGVDGAVDEGEITFGGATIPALFKRAKGILNVPLGNGSPSLTLSSGSEIEIRDTGAVSANNHRFWLTRTPYTDTMSDAIDAPLFMVPGNSDPYGFQPIRENQDLSLYKIDPAKVFLSVNGAPSQMALYWMQYADIAGGLVVWENMEIPTTTTRENMLMFGATRQRAFRLYGASVDPDWTLEFIYDENSSNEPPNEYNVTDPHANSSQVLNIETTNPRGVYFSSGSNYAGKVMGIKNNNVGYKTSDTDTNPNHVNYLIAVENENKGENGEITAAAIDLTYASGTANSEFTITLDNEAITKEYRFFAKAGSLSAEGSGATSSAVIGVSHANGLQSSIDYINLEANDALVKWYSVAHSFSNYAYSATIGTGRALNGVTLSDLNVTNIGIGSVLSSVARSESSSHSAFGTVMGAGSADGSNTRIGDWHINKIGDGSTLVTSATSAQPGGNIANKIGSFGSVFGAGYASAGATFFGWQVDAIGNNVVLSESSTALAGDLSANGAVFGVAYCDDAGKNVQNWSVEFVGNATLSAVGYAGSGANINLGTMGGYQNGGTDASDGMRFYLNDGEAANPSVVVAALKLSSAWTVGDNKTATATVASSQGETIRAVALGPNFQLNVGRKRVLDDDGYENTGSIGSGGIKYGGAGTIHLLGEVSMAHPSEQDKIQTGTVMRIDSGWKVNAYQSVRDFEKIEIIDGSLNLMRNGDTLTNTNAEFSAAMSKLRNNIAYSHYNKGDKEHEVYQNDGVSSNKRSGRTGNVNLTTSGYPINGQLTVGNGQKLIFGVNTLAAKEKISIGGGEIPSLFNKSNGVLNVPLVEPGGTNQSLIFKPGSKIEIKNSGGELTDSARFLLVRTPYTDSIRKAIDGVTFVYTAPFHMTDVDQNLYLYKINPNNVALGGGSSNLALYWMRYSNIANGIAVWEDMIQEPPPDPHFTSTRQNKLLLSALDGEEMTLTFLDDQVQFDNVPKNTENEADAFVDSNAQVLNIESTSASGIYFDAGYNYAGATLVFDNSNVSYDEIDGYRSVDYLISTINASSSNSAAIDLANASGTGIASPFTVKLVGNGGSKTYRFFAKAGPSNGTKYATTIGVPDADGENFSVNYFIFNADLAKIELYSIANSTNNVTCSAAIGSARARDLTTFTRWNIKNIGANSTISSLAKSDSQNDAHGVTIGVGRFDGTNTDIADWLIGSIGNGSTLVVSAESGYQENSGTAYGSVLGAGRSGNGISGWQINDVKTDAVLSASSSGNFAYGTAIGIANGEGGATNWTTEFIGNATISAVGYASSGNNIHLGTLGGHKNGGTASSDGMRFYFNGRGATDPSVVVAALKLSNGWDTNTAETARATIGADQGTNHSTDALAVALGPNFQLNIGRSRELDGNGKEKMNGGVAAGNPGTMHILGSIAMAPDSTSANGSAMHIDSGWKVNAYRPIRDLSVIEIMNGSLNLMASGDTFTGTDSKFTAAMDQLEHNIAYTGTNGIFQNDGKTSQKRANREGNIAVDGRENYPIDGTLTVGNSQTLIFGVNPMENETKANFGGNEIDISMFHKAKGTITLPLSPGNPRLVFGNGSKIGIKSSDGIDPSIGSLFWIVRTPYTQNIGDVVDFGEDLFVSDLKHDLSSDPMVTLYEILSGGNLDEASCAGLALYWMEYGDAASGLVIGNHGIMLVPPDTGRSYYNRELANGQMDQIPALNNALVSTIGTMQSIIWNMLCDIKGKTDDPFVKVFGAHSNEALSGELECGNNTYGVLAGLDAVEDLGDGAFFRYGASLGFADNNAKFSGNAAANGMGAKQRVYFGGIFGGYEEFDADGLKTNLGMVLGLARMDNNCWRIDSDGNRFESKYTNFNLSLNCGFITSFAKIMGVQIGPWASISYNWIRQNGYSESGAANYPFSTNDINFHLVDTVLGISLEREFYSAHDEEKRTKLFARIGWFNGSLHTNSVCEVTVGDFTCTQSLNVRTSNSLAISCGFRSKINRNFEISGGVFWKVGRHRSNIDANFGVGYSF
ncbi:MAG: hypothetical protein LBB18_02300 [Puniceicoccales bacterium]|jgi:hypothetical protein|nr:hypothetical protein [Puniceicoccales bacterium]